MWICGCVLACVHAFLMYLPLPVRMRASTFILASVTVWANESAATICNLCKIEHQHNSIWMYTFIDYSRDFNNVSVRTCGRRLVKDETKFWETQQECLCHAAPVTNANTYASSSRLFHFSRGGFLLQFELMDYLKKPASGKCVHTSRPSRLADCCCCCCWPKKGHPVLAHTKWLVGIHQPSPLGWCVFG